MAAPKRRVTNILNKLETLYPEVECELDHETPFQLLVATILSAQCTDERVNKVTPALFEAYPTPDALAQADQDDVEALIRSTGFFRQKAKNIIGTARLLVTEHGGDLPRDLKSLAQMPGAARKTASVVLGTCFNLAEGVVVDTHVQRLALRMGLTQNTSVTKIEKDLMEILPHKVWIRFSHQIIWHGRRVCFARKPACDDCILVPHCPSSFKET